jgi:hypothetical protein
MRVPRDQKPFLRAEGLRRLVNYTGDEARRLLLVEAFDAYAGLRRTSAPSTRNFCDATSIRRFDP